MKRAWLAAAGLAALYDLRHYPFTGIHEKWKGYMDRDHIRHIDLLPAFSAFAPDDLWANPTDYHPNEIAHRVAADELFKYVKSSIGSFKTSLEIGEGLPVSGGSHGDRQGIH